MNEVKIFSPATIANLSCGFDVLGLCLDNVGDEMIIRKSKSNGITITKIEGADLPLEAANNVAGVAAIALLETLDIDYGFEIEIYKHIKAGSGIGSSAASAAGAVFGINCLLEKPLTALELIPFAMQGEVLACGSAHADNVAPALLGGCTLVRSYSPLDVIKIPTPEHLYATVIHPQIELKTSDARSILKKKVSLADAISQWGNVAGLVAGMFTNDYKLIGRSLQDSIVEPIRSILIPGFADIKRVAMANGALGAGISGSGPSVYALCEGEKDAKQVAASMCKVYDDMNLKYEIHICRVNPVGIKII